MGLSGLVACGIGAQVVSFLHPYRMLYDHQEREFGALSGLKKPEGPSLPAHISIMASIRRKLARPSGLVSVQPDDLLAGSPGQKIPKRPPISAVHPLPLRGF